MPEPKVEYWQCSEIHVSVGALVVQKGQILLMDRAKPPYGLAGPAGHVDEGETQEIAILREVQEESGLVVINKKLILEEFVPWNTCSQGIEGHRWFLYQCDVKGALHRSKAEAKSLGWYAISDIDTSKLEPVWQYWLAKPEVKEEIGA